MKANSNRFRAVKFRFETDAGTFRERHMIVDNHMPLFRVNRRLELKGIRKANTRHAHAKKMAVYLNRLDSKGGVLRGCHKPSRPTVSYHFGSVTIKRLPDPASL
jgi:hypothetical protein